MNHGVGTHSRISDLTDEDQVRKLFAGVKNDLGRLVRMTAVNGVGLRPR
jgi:hypothetical protein